MKPVCVITGGGSGIGLATAKILGQAHYIVISGRNAPKLDQAIAELKSDGVDAEAFVCDVADRSSVEQMAAHAKSLGRIAAVINAAGMSPHMGEAKKIMEANALGTINVNKAFYEVMEEGSCVVAISSMSAHVTPKIIMPVGCYKYSRSDKEIFIKKMMARVNLFPQKLRSDLAYCISKHFVIWYAKTDAAKMGEKGIRIVSVSPGSIATPMSELETDSARSIKYCAIKRFGRAEELANLIAFCISEKASYITGIDILCDGGCVASGYNPLKHR
ncbi:MAG: short-chain dehydrogenase/reductase [Massilibacillus sp.]|jgi:NAD(P)-dependent dehydrogenase (short-subunit alcohol dehydrogenase family)|nr:short-chain dehydrogenase/reductase [Massilibacillus sp.]